MSSRTDQQEMLGSRTYRKKRLQLSGLCAIISRCLELRSFRTFKKLLGDKILEKGFQLSESSHFCQGFLPCEPLFFDSDKLDIRSGSICGSSSDQFLSCKECFAPRKRRGSFRGRSPYVQPEGIKTTTHV